MADGSQEVLDTIPSFTQGEQPPAVPSGDAQPHVETSPAPGAEGVQPGEPGPPKTALEAAERVMATEAKGVSPPSKPQDGKPQEAKPPLDPKAAEDARLPFANHPRWKEVTSENRILRVAKEKNETAIKELEPKAQTYDDLTGFVRDSGLSKDDFAAMLSIGAAIRNDPFQAYEMLKPIMARIESMVGERLPQDLQTAVDNQSMTPEAASAIARSRAEATVYKGQAAAANQRFQETENQRQQREADEHAQGVVQDIGACIDTWASRDPDADKKRPFVEEAIELELRRIEGRGETIRSADDVQKLINTAVDQVNKRMRSFAPAPQARSGPLPSGGTPPNAAPTPKTSLEAAQLGLARAAPA